MIDAETCLLIAVRDRLRTRLELRDTECDVELDDQVPAVSGDLYITVTPAGGRAGPRHATSGGAIDVMFGCRVTVFQKMADVPRDRRRSVFLERARGVNKRLDAVMSAIDFSYDVTTAATALLVAGQFVEPFKFTGLDDRPQPVVRDAYDAAGAITKGGDPVLAIKRGINFFGARFMKAR